MWLKVVSLLITLFGVNSSNILCLFPVPFYSHQGIFNILVEELAKRGHNIVVMTPQPHAYKIENVTEINVKSITVTTWKNNFIKNIQTFDDLFMEPDRFSGEVINPTLSDLFQTQLDTEAMQELLHDETNTFDLIIAETCAPSLITISARFQAPIVSFSTLIAADENLEMIGAPTHPFFYFDFWDTQLYNLTVLDKLSILKRKIKFLNVAKNLDIVNDEITQKYFGEQHSFSRLKENVKLLVINSVPIWDSNRPKPMSLIYSGSLNLKKPKPLEKTYQDFMDSSPNGVVYMSFGSKFNISDMPARTVNLFMETFKTLPYNFLIKWSGGHLDEIPNNVRLEEWLPQVDLLNHPNMKLFITHCGLQSADETIAANVPVIGVPLCGDQSFNAQRYTQFGVGEQVDLRNINGQDFRELIIRVAEGKSYRRNLAKLSRIMADHQEGGLQRTIHGIEHLMRYGNKHLKVFNAKDILFDYFLVDVVLTLLSIFGVILVIIHLLKKYVLKGIWK